jgi:hypothetical protein
VWIKQGYDGKEASPQSAGDQHLPQRPRRRHFFPQRPRWLQGHCLFSQQRRMETPSVFAAAQQGLHALKAE